jgi:hypothetical protein
MPTLEAKITARIKLLSDIVDLVDNILREKGRVLERHIGSSNTNLVEELKDFENFSFWSDTGQTMFGGNSYKIWYKRGTDKVLVLHLDFQAGIEEAEITTFDPKRDWLNALKRLIKNWKQMMVKSERERKIQEKKSQRQCRQEVVNNALREKAVRLGIL